MIEQGTHRIEHVPVAQIPGLRRAAVHRPIVVLRGKHHPRVAFGIEEALAVLVDVRQALGEQSLQLFNDGVFAGRLAEHDVAAVVGRVFLPGAQATIAPPGSGGGRRIGAIQIIQHFAHRAAEAIDVQAAKLDALLGGQRGIVLTQPAHEAVDLAIAPHPAREALEGIFGPGDGLALPTMAVDARGIGPVRLDRDDGEPVLFDQPPGDCGAGPIELGSAVAGLTDQHDPRVGVALEGVGEARLVEGG